MLTGRSRNRRSGVWSGNPIESSLSRSSDDERERLLLVVGLVDAELAPLEKETWIQKVFENEQNTGEQELNENDSPLSIRLYHFEAISHTSPGGKCRPQLIGGSDGLPEISLVQWRST